MARIRYRWAYVVALPVLWGGMIWASDRERSADDTFRTAERLFHLRRYDEAAPHFGRITTICNSSTRGERSLYYLAECQYQQKRYIEAFETFERLHTAYPATEFREQLVDREYEMGEFWLACANGEQRGETTRQSSEKIDAPRTAADFRQLALRAFNAVRQNDPTGVKAGDAAMRIAGYYMSTRDYDTAGLYYEQFVNEYCKSPLRTSARIGRLEASIRGFVAAHRVLFSSLLTLIIVFFCVLVRTLGRCVIASGRGQESLP